MKQGFHLGKRLKVEKSRGFQKWLKQNSRVFETNESSSTEGSFAQTKAV